MHEVVKYSYGVEQKPSRIDRLLKAGVWLNVVTVPFWILVGRPDIALLDIGSGVVTESARKKIKEVRGRFRLGRTSARLSAAGA